MFSHHEAANRVILDFPRSLLGWTKDAVLRQFRFFSSMATQDVVLQEATPLCESMIWDLQDQFYIRKGPSCWTDFIVPHFVTSNSYIAYQYANCILRYIRDYYSS